MRFPVGWIEWIKVPKGAMWEVFRLWSLFAGQGFAFVDVYRKEYDVWLMNPPFGAVMTCCQDLYATTYPLSKADMAGVFV